MDSSSYNPTLKNKQTLSYPFKSSAISDKNYFTTLKTRVVECILNFKVTIGIVTCTLLLLSFMQKYQSLAPASQTWQFAAFPFILLSFLDYVQLQVWLWVISL